MSSVLPAHLARLLAPAPIAVAHSERLSALIAEAIASSGGWIPFARYMDLALHAPGLGYYSAGARKFGADGDFVTAPELGSLFGRTLARQAAQCLRAGLPDILEFGAGSGRLARDLLAELAALDCVPRRYLILETSAELKARQRDLLQRELPQLAPRIDWLENLPCAFDGLIIGNEVLDAMPVHVIKTRGEDVDELGVIAARQGFLWAERPASAELRDRVRLLRLPDRYQTEIHLAGSAFVRTLAAHLARGVVLLIDYGFPAREYYHPQRSEGTLMCHYRQHVHDDPLSLVGLQDITAHIDFSTIARSGVEAGLSLLGYATQAQFLVNCGVTEILAATPPADTAAYLPLAAQAQQLTSPAAMGELFKVIAFGRNHHAPLAGFTRGNKQRLL